MKPVCSIIIAAYNEQRRLAGCLESLLTQSFSPIEILVVDDGSTDETVAVAKQFPQVRVLAQSHTGKAAAVNLGAREAAGEVLFFLDADMVFDKEYIRQMIQPILSGEAQGTAHAREYVANPENVWSACLQIRGGLPPRERLRLTPAAEREGSLVYRAVRRDDFLRVGGFDHTGYMDDQTLAPKLGGNAKWVSEALCYHYNPETLHEVFASGIWSGKTLALQRGTRLIFSYFPARTLLRASRKALRERKPAMLVFELTFELGVFYGGCRFLARWDKSYGK